MTVPIQPIVIQHKGLGQAVNEHVQSFLGVVAQQRELALEKQKVQLDARRVASQENLQGAQATQIREDLKAKEEEIAAMIAGNEIFMGSFVLQENGSMDIDHSRLAERMQNADPRTIQHVVETMGNWQNYRVAAANENALDAQARYNRVLTQAQQFANNKEGVLQGLFAEQRDELLNMDQLPTDPTQIPMKMAILMEWMGVLNLVRDYAEQQTGYDRLRLEAMRGTSILINQSLGEALKLYSNMLQGAFEAGTEIGGWDQEAYQQAYSQIPPLSSLIETMMAGQFTPDQFDRFMEMSQEILGIPTTAIDPRVDASREQTARFARLIEANPNVRGLFFGDERAGFPRLPREARSALASLLIADVGNIQVQRTDTTLEVRLNAARQVAENQRLGAESALSDEEKREFRRGIDILFSPPTNRRSGIYALMSAFRNAVVLNDMSAQEAQNLILRLLYREPEEVQQILNDALMSTPSQPPQ